MKKQYKEPQIYVENINVEQGIAMSTVDLLWQNGDAYDPFGLGEGTTYGEETFNW